MKLLFVENRYATRLYEAVARELAADHEIHWLVQNPLFAPKWGSVHLLAFPKSSAPYSDVQDPMFARIQNLDRGITHFGLRPTHYPHYLAQIKAVLGAVKPDVVFGECTQFHELMTIELARRSGVPYLFPAATRYPPGRVAFHAYDTMETVGGSGEQLGEHVAADLVQRINSRAVIPSYMEAPSRFPSVTWSKRLVDRARITYGWLRGERFVTPSPWRKLALENRRRRDQRTWEKLASARMRTTRPYVLYPLQMQPENNLDVWGAEWSDQSDLVRRLAASLRRLEFDLLVKPNPSSYYELSRTLCQVIERAPNVVPLSHATTMHDVFPEARAIVSVTGTVLIESVFAGKPAFSLGAHAMVRYDGITGLVQPEDIVDHLVTPKPSRSEHLALNLICMLHRTSYPGLWPDPLRTPAYLDRANTQALARAFEHVLQHVAPGRATVVPVTGGQ